MDFFPIFNKALTAYFVHENCQDNLNHAVHMGLNSWSEPATISREQLHTVGTKETQLVRSHSFREYLNTYGEDK